MNVVDLGWTVRYLSALTEACDSDRQSLGACSDPAAGTNHLDSVVYNDLRALVKLPAASRTTLAAGVNNVFGQDPPIARLLAQRLRRVDYDLPRPVRVRRGEGRVLGARHCRRKSGHQLQVRQARIQPALLHQLRRRADFDDAALFQHDDAVGALHRPKGGAR